MSAIACMPADAIHAWRQGIAPQLGLPALRALESALERDDPALLQGVTCQASPPMDPVARTLQPWGIKGCCLIAYAEWKARGLTQAREAEEAFAKLCQAATTDPDSLTAWHLTRWWDNADRDEAVRLMLDEVRREILRRELPEGEEP